MPEIFEICDSYTVLRDGRLVGSGRIAEINQQKATEMLIGKIFTDEISKDHYEKEISDEVLLSVEDVSGNTFSDVSFNLKKGEVVVITGLQGSGTEELATALFGASQIKKGIVRTKKGQINRKSISHVMRSGIGMIPKNRKERGIIPDLSIERNSSSAFFTALHRKLFISYREEAERFENNRKKLEIKIGKPSDPITSLSGGNQQKVILGKWLNIDADVYIMDNPTQGIDVGAKFSIYNLINSISAEGKGILVFTNEYPEMVQVADRVIIMYKGKIVKNLSREEMSEVSVMGYSTGSLS